MVERQRTTDELRAIARAAVRVGQASAYAMIAEVQEFQRQNGPTMADEDLSVACRDITDAIERLERVFRS